MRLSPPSGVLYLLAERRAVLRLPFVSWRLWLQRLQQMTGVSAWKMSRVCLGCLVYKELQALQACSWDCSGECNGLTIGPGCTAHNYIGHTGQEDTNIPRPFILDFD